MKNYVDIQSTYPSGAVANRSFGGMVFTPSEMADSADSSIKASFDAGDCVSLSLDEISTCFGASTNEHAFAAGYYGYVSPSGETASKLSFAKVKSERKEVEGDEVTVFETASEAFERLVSNYDMFGSVTFLNGTGDDGHKFTLDELKQVSALITGSSEASLGTFNKFLLVVNDVRGEQTAEAVAAKAAEFNSAVGTVFVSGANECSGYMPMAVFAAVDYAAGTSTQHMFRKFSGEDAVVKGQEEFETLKTGRVNFIGRTQCNGVNFDFYQPGVNTDGNPTEEYCNEVWFRSACASSLLTYLTGENRITADANGLLEVRSRVNSVCRDAISNGSFIAKELDDEALMKVRNLLRNMNITPSEMEIIIGEIETVGFYTYAFADKNRFGERICRYYVFYSTGDSIKAIKGDDILIK